jgi:serine/threonine protein kinase
MATVYLSHDLKHDRPVALKVMDGKAAAILGTDRFLREIKLAARLQHPHILPVFDSGEAKGQLWYTMPFVAGEGVRNLLDREGGLPLDVALRIAGQVADALDHAHRHGVVHRDVKPENILLSETHAWLADFGVAHAAGGASERLTEIGMVVGTPAYMSPEQASGDVPLDGRTDIYALGCVLYEMLTGRPPYRGATPAAVLAQQLTGPVPSLRATRVELPVWIDRVVAKALSKSPADRFATAASLAAALVAPPATEVVLAAPAEKSVAVLPFANLSADPDNEFFADGMTDEVINALAKCRVSESCHARRHSPSRASSWMFVTSGRSSTCRRSSRAAFGGPGDGSVSVPSSPTSPTVTSSGRRHSIESWRTSLRYRMNCRGAW